VCAQVDTHPCRPVRLLCCLSRYSFPLACAIAPPWPALPSRCMALLTTANRLLPDLCTTGVHARNPPQRIHPPCKGFTSRRRERTPRPHPKGALGRRSSRGAGQSPALVACLSLSNRFVSRQRTCLPRFGIADGMPLLGQWGSPGCSWRGFGGLSYTQGIVYSIASRPRTPCSVHPVFVTSDFLGWRRAGRV
jgi:hypothetical protein